LDCATEVIEPSAKIAGEFLGAHSAAIAQHERMLYVECSNSHCTTSSNKSQVRNPAKTKTALRQQMTRDIRFRVG
jgi:hypothetical protein